ncbi:MAG: tRNA (adenosine(37)-N6)-dimethylallyltransferase MiaA [Actinobacteria bacterium]|nr:tRNA (adenosine(37)-N6)-dimethylallyltransferase MiaA [Actinomycetota bacterium]
MMDLIKESDLKLIEDKKSNNINIDNLKKDAIKNKKVITICGPTCVGKTKIAINLAAILKTDIISVDSIQIYKGMDIGTDKYDTEKYNLKQYMISIFNPDHNVTVVEFRDICRKIIEDEFFLKDKIPLLVGGSGLYIRGVIDELNFVQGKDKIIRKKLKENIKKYGLSVYYEKLKKIDPAYSKKISINDERRIIRALEVYKITGKPFSFFQNKWESRKSIYNNSIFGIEIDRPELYKNIEERVNRMFSRGLVKEVKSLIEKGYKDCNSILQAVGYKEVVKYINGEINLHECVDEVKRNTRRLAKKQMTWFKSDPGIKWIRTDSYGNIIDLIVDILSIINNSVVN